MKLRTLAHGVAVAGMVVAGALATAGPAQADSQHYARVVGTGGIGVACRNGPTINSDRCGYGAPEWAPSPPKPAGYGVVKLDCFYRYGDPVGSNNNDLWWRVEYGGKTFFVADHWLDTPAPVNHTTPWNDIYGCQ